LSPSGEHLMDAFFAAGGIPAVMKELPKLDHDCRTVTGATIGDVLQSAKCYDRDVIRSQSDPLSPSGSISVLTGNLAPDGAILKISAASPELLQHRGRAVVFANYRDMLARIDDPALPVDKDSVLVLQNAGPKGVPGFPEWGMIPVPRKLLEQGVTDLVRISDSRMSGTSFGTVVLHVSPESAAGGPLAIVRDGDGIALDHANRRLHLDVSETELASRASGWHPPPSPHRRGYPRLYVDHVLQAHEGCDFDFCRPESDADLKFVPPVVGRS
ncbi:MAG: dihydroxy-acid dehydratase, partial [Planctomycetaceae bacterium]